MSLVGSIASAQPWRAFFFFSGLAVAAIAAESVKPPDLAQVGLPGATEAKKILEQFRLSGIPGQYFLEFELHQLPRRGDEVVYRGRFWGGRNEQGAITRVELTVAAGKTLRLLVQDGERPAVWRFAEGKVAQLGIAESFEPLTAGLEITAFDLQRPFLYWPDGSIERLARILGRPAYAYLFRPPAAVAAQHRELVAVRAYLDTQYNALMQIDYLGRQGLLKTIAVLSLQKIGEQYILKSFDVRNEVSHDKTRFLVTGAALNLELAPAVFAPGSLGDEIQSPSGIVRINP